MLRREIVPLPEDLYPRDPWRLVELGYDRRYADRAETIFALGNGFLGVRGTLDEGRPSLSPGTFVNGFYETWPIVHAEDAYGLARVGQTIVNVPDPTVLALYVEDEPLFLPTARVRDYRRVLDFRDGTLVRELVWSTASGRHLKVRSCRLVSLESRHVFAVRYEVTVLDHPTPVVICSRLVNHQDRPMHVPEQGCGLTDPRLAKQFPERVLNLQRERHLGDRLMMCYRTTHSGMSLAVGIHHVPEVSNRHEATSRPDSDRSEVVFSVDAEPGDPIRVTKYVAYHSAAHTEPDELLDRCEWTLDRVTRGGFDGLLAAQRRNLERFWERADVQVDAEDDADLLQQAIRWNLFQVAQATWRVEGSGVPAKGLTGQAYEGHYFWDTEIYLQPFLCYTQPRIVRNLLRFRHSLLPMARARAAELDLAGAKYPWRTINGAEASAYYEAGTAQFHINADIAYAIRRYLHVRDDIGFLAEAGAEILVETARMWADLGFYGDDGAFHIHGVTGPDEYTTVVNDNTYTNLLARLNLRFAVAALGILQQARPHDYAALADALRLRDSDMQAWERAATAMAIPYDHRRGIHPQDAAFLDREVWNLAATPKDKFPLLLHYHPLAIYRRQVIKQSDVVLAAFLLGDEFSTEQKRNDFAYYDPITTDDSSLSACVQAVVAAEIGAETPAMGYFHYALMMDLADIEGNVSDGVHIASAGGVWLAIAYGFAGLRDFDGQLSFNPALPARWTRLRLPLRFHDRQLDVSLGHNQETYRLIAGDPLEVTVRGSTHRLTVGRSLTVEPPARQ